MKGEAGLGAHPEAPLIVEAEVTEPGAAVPPRGPVYGLQVDRYRVLGVLQGSYDDDVLFAAREAGAPFSVGDRLRLTLSPTLPEAASPVITDPAEVHRVGLFYLDTFERT